MILSYAYELISISFLIGIGYIVFIKFTSMKKKLYYHQITVSEQNQTLEKMRHDKLINEDLLIRNQKQINELEEAKKIAVQENINLKIEIARLETKYDTSTKNEKIMQTSYENLANRILASKVNEFSKLAQKDISSTLLPLKQQITNFHNTIINSAKDCFSLKNEVKNLSETSKELSKALNGNNKILGNWGETILQRILEISGLKKGIDYITQSGQDSRPDYVIQLPEERQLVIDVKTHFKSYENYINSDSEIERKKHVNELIKSVRNSIKNLSSKNYHSINKISSLDFIIMFLPIDNAFSLVMEYDIEMYQFAWDHGIIITCPSSILAILRIIKIMWKVEKQALHSQEIAEQGGKIHDKLVGFISYMDKIDSSLQSACNRYSDAKKVLLGRDNLIKNAEKLKEMGVNNKKALQWNYEN